MNLFHCGWGEPQSLLAQASLLRALVQHCFRRRTCAGSAVNYFVAFEIYNDM
jgi:hypothetical protein